MNDDSDAYFIPDGIFDAMGGPSSGNEECQGASSPNALEPMQALSHQKYTADDLDAPWEDEERLSLSGVNPNAKEFTPNTPVPPEVVHVVDEESVLFAPEGQELTLSSGDLHNTIAPHVHGLAHDFSAESAMYYFKARDTMLPEDDGTYSWPSELAQRGGCQQSCPYRAYDDDDFAGYRRSANYRPGTVLLSDSPLSIRQHWCEESAPCGPALAYLRQMPAGSSCDSSPDEFPVLPHRTGHDDRHQNTSHHPRSAWSPPQGMKKMTWAEAACGQPPPLRRNPLVRNSLEEEAAPRILHRAKSDPRGCIIKRDHFFVPDASSLRRASRSPGKKKQRGGGSTVETFPYAAANPARDRKSDLNTNQLKYVEARSHPVYEKTKASAQVRMNVESDRIFDDGSTSPRTLSKSPRSPSKLRRMRRKELERNLALKRERIEREAAINAREVVLMAQEDAAMRVQAVIAREARVVGCRWQEGHPEESQFKSSGLPEHSYTSRQSVSAQTRHVDSAATHMRKSNWLHACVRNLLKHLRSLHTLAALELRCASTVCCFTLPFIVRGIDIVAPAWTGSLLWTATVVCVLPALPSTTIRRNESDLDRKRIARQGLARNVDEKESNRRTLYCNVSSIATWMIGVMLCLLQSGPRSMLSDLDDANLLVVAFAMAAVRHGTVFDPLTLACWSSHVFARALFGNRWIVRYAQLVTALSCLQRATQVE